MKAFLVGDPQKGVASWRKAFQKQWKQYQNRAVSPDSLKKLHTCPKKWGCGYDPILLSRFLICKHLIHSRREIEDLVKFFGSV